ncbi:SBBP repeat-containing protein, partial [Leptospira ellisii]
MNNKYSSVKIRLIVFVILLFTQCKHENKNSLQENLFLLQLLSGFSIPGPKAEWTRLSGVNGKSTFAYSIITDKDSGIYVTGNTVGNLDNQTLSGFQDLFLTKYNTAGDKQWTRLLGLASTTTEAVAVTSDTLNNVYATGNTNNALDGEVFIG